MSILSARGTLNRVARSGENTVDTTDTLGQLQAVSRVVHDRERTLLRESLNHRTERRRCRGRRIGALSGAGILQSRAPARWGRCSGAS